MNEYDSIIKSIRNHLGFYKKDNDTLYNNCVLLFAFNGTGKTRLSYEFAHKDRINNQHHTLYYNAFTEDLFTWNNDLEGNTDRYMVINTDSALIRAFDGYDYDEGINAHLSTLVGFKAHFESHEHDSEGKIIDHPGDNIPREVWFSRKISDTKSADYIKISRGEERLFVWCVFRYLIDQVVNGDPNFKNIQYIYIDDPMSSLDDNNVMRFSAQLYELINKCHKDVVSHFVATNQQDTLGLPHFIISTHHSVFYNTMRNGLESSFGYSLYRDYSQSNNGNIVFTHYNYPTPVFYHLSMLTQIKKEFDKLDDGKPCNLQNYHFNVMRGILEQFTQLFGQRRHGAFGHILDDIVFHFNGEEYTAQDADNAGFTQLMTNALNALSHSGNNMFEPPMLSTDNIQLLRDIFEHIKNKYNIEIPPIDPPIIK